MVKPRSIRPTVQTVLVLVISDQPNNLANKFKKLKKLKYTRSNSAFSCDINA
jgi:hypothetical protein